MDAVNMSQEDKIFSIDVMLKALADTLTVDKLFDVYRFVDMETHLVHNYVDGKMVDSVKNVIRFGIAANPALIVHRSVRWNRKSRS